MLITPLQEINDPLFVEKGVRVFVKRDDLIHPVISGNKWRKLKYNLLVARRQRHDTLLTFGGAFSNHIHAVAAAGRACGFKTIGVIRGEAYDPLNPTLQAATDDGMRLVYLDRETYRRKREPQIRQKLQRMFGRFYAIPEGGCNALAVIGCSDIVLEVRSQLVKEAFSIVTGVGTGATLAGLVAGMKGMGQAIGISVLKNAHSLDTDVETLLTETGHGERRNWTLMHDYHRGGYAKLDAELIAFVDDFFARHHIPVDPIYTGKTFYALYELIREGYFPRGETIVALHTGGLQGIRGMQDQIEALRKQNRERQTAAAVRDNTA